MWYVLLYMSLCNFTWCKVCEWLYVALQPIVRVSLKMLKATITDCEQGNGVISRSQSVKRCGNLWVTCCFVCVCVCTWVQDGVLHGLQTRLQTGLSQRVQVLPWLVQAQCWGWVSLPWVLDRSMGWEVHTGKLAEGGALMLWEPLRREGRRARNVNSCKVT